MTFFALMTPKKIHVTIPLCMMVILYWLSSIPGTPLPDDPAAYALFHWIAPSLQNMLHVPAYAALAGTWHWALGAWMRSSIAIALIAGGVAVLYSVFDEWHQSFVPGRFASFTDIALDFAGAMLGLWLAARMGR